MKYIKKFFEDFKEKQNFWKGAEFDLADISMALMDKQLNSEALYFSVMFSQPEIVLFLTNFEIDFHQIKTDLGVPAIYIARADEFKDDFTAETLLRDKTKIKQDTQMMKQSFAVMINKLEDEFQPYLTELSIEENKDISSEILNCQDLKNLFFRPKIKKTIENMKNKKG